MIKISLSTKEVSALNDDFVDCDHGKSENEDYAPRERAGDFYVSGEYLTGYFGPGGDVTIPEGFTKIDRRVFQCGDAVNITGITIPKSVTVIDTDAFSFCTNLREIRVEEGNPHYCVVDDLLLKRDGRGDFVLHTCPAARSGVLEIPEGVVRIAGFACRGCAGLTGVNIPGSVWKIGEYAFSGCSSLTHVTIPEGVKCIGEAAFYHCTNLTHVAMLEGVRYIGEEAFLGCMNLTHVALPGSVRKVYADAFWGTGMSEEAVRAAYEQVRENAMETGASAPGDLPDEEAFYLLDDED